MADIQDDTLNTTLYDELGNPVTVVLGTKNALAVDATISGDESPTKYQLRWDIDDIGTSVPSTDTLLYSFSGVGILDFVATSAGNSGYDVSIRIDGVERFRSTMAQLGSLGLSNAVNVPVWAETALKNFRINPSEGFGFSTGFEVYAKSTGSTRQVRHAAMYREKT